MTAHSCVGTEAEHGAQTRLGGAAVQAVVVGRCYPHRPGRLPALWFADKAGGQQGSELGESTWRPDSYRLTPSSGGPGARAWGPTPTCGRPHTAHSPLRGPQSSLQG